MSRIVAVAPRLSDAVCSAGGTLAGHAADGHEVIALCLFGTGSPAEEEAARALALAGVIHAGLGDADARGYAPGTAAHDGVAEADDAPRVAGAALTVALGNLDPQLVLAPLGLTGHVDQTVLDTALDALRVERLRWVDLPYALARTPGAPLGAGEQVVVPVGGGLEAKLTAAALLGGDAARLRAHAEAEGERLGAGEPVELFVKHFVFGSEDSPGGSYSR